MSIRFKPDQSPNSDDRNSQAAGQSVNSTDGQASTDSPIEPVARKATEASAADCPQLSAEADEAQAEKKPDDASRRLARRLEILTHPAIAIPLILIVGALLFIVNLGGAPIYTKGEAREAVTVFDIVHGGGLILPMRAGVEIPSKPLMMHWLAALISLIAGGVSSWTVRLPSAILAIAGAIATYLYVRRLFEARSALLGSLILLTSIQYLQAGTGSRVDMTLTFFLTIAFFEFLMVAEGVRTQTIILYLAIAMAVLTKGPIGALLPAIVALIWIALTWRWTVIRRMQLLRGALIVGVLGGGWYLLAILTGGMAFVHKQILAENLYRLTGHKGVNEGHAHPFYYEDAALLAGFMPWTTAGAIALVQAIRRPRRLEPRIGYLLVWSLAVLIFYNLPESKRGVYLLALYPALAALVALYLGDAITYPSLTRRSSRAVMRLNGVAFILIASGAVAGIGLIYASPDTFNRLLGPIEIVIPQLPFALRTAISRFPPIAIALPTIVLALGLFLFRSHPRADKIVFATSGAMIAIALAVNLVVQPALAECLTLKDFAADVSRIAGGSSPGFFGTVDYDFAFYSGRNLTLIDSHDADPPAFIVCTQDGLRLMPAAMRSRYTVVLTSHPTDLDGSGMMYLLRRSEPSQNAASGT
jgi:4-amino-4-deoxy-L-arabinose transferase-like glycosyltransferase